MSDDKNPSSNEDKGQAPEVGEAKGVKIENSPAPLQELPEKFKGKSPQEIAKAYVELESKIGEQSKSIEEATKLREETDTLLRAIWSDPDLYRQVEAGVKKYTTGETMPEIRKPTDDKGDREAKNDKNEVNPQIQDLRVAEENRVLSSFFTKFGYNSLSEKDRKESYQRLVVSLAETYDPAGKKPIKQILSEIPLAKLERYLENAHWLANKDQIVEKAKRSATFSTIENNAASIGSFSSGASNQGNSVTLTGKERETADKLGISHEKYLKRKIETMKDSSRYES